MNNQQFFLFLGQNSGRDLQKLLEGKKSSRRITPFTNEPSLCQLFSLLQPKGHGSSYSQVQLHNDF